MGIRKVKGYGRTVEGTEGMWDMVGRTVYTDDLRINLPTIKETLSISHRIVKAKS